MAERAAHNRPVGGSSPPAPTRTLLFLLLVILLHFDWKPYEFKEREIYFYTYRETFKGERRSGSFTINVEKVREGYRVRIKGAYHRWRGSLERVFRDAEELAGFVLMRMYFEHWLIPLGRTVLSWGLVRALKRKERDWSLGEKELREGIVRKVVPCRVGGFEGRMLVVEEGEREVFKLCFGGDIPLPLYMMRRDFEGNTFEMELEGYYSK